MGAISLGRVTTLLLLGRAASYGLALANSVVLARALGVERLGSYAYAVGVAGLFALVPHMGISTLVTRAIARDTGDADGIVPAALRAQAFLAGGVLVLVTALAAVLPGQPVPLAYVALAAAQLAVGTLAWPYLAVVSGHARYDRVAVAEVAAAAGTTATFLGAALGGGGVIAFLWAHLAGAAFAVLAARRVAGPFLPAPGPRPLALGALFRHVAPLGATTVVQSVYTRLDVVMLGQMASPVALGLYSAAYKPINFAVHFGGAIAGPLLPVMAQQPSAGTSRTLERVLRGLGAAAPAMAFCLTGLADPFLRILYGPAFGPAAPMLAVLAWSAAANWLYAPLGVTLQARGQERWWLGSLTVALALNAVGNLWAIPRWGGGGAAAATLVSEGALLAFGLVLVRRALGIPLRGRAIAVGVGATAAGAATLWGFWAAGPWAATATALLVYVGLLACFRVVTSDDAATVLGWLRDATLGWSRGRA